MKPLGTALALILLLSGCRERQCVDAPPPLRLPSMQIQPSDQDAILKVSVSNPSGKELTIPGFGNTLIYGSYWYQDDKVVDVPQCGTGFWDSVITIPAGQTKQLELLVPHSVARGDRYTVAVVYKGLGASTEKDDHKSMSVDEFFRHPDIRLHCRKMKAEIILPKP